MTVEAPADSKSIARRYADVSGAALLRAVIEREFVGRIALVSSFGADSAVLLHMVSEIAPALPVLFLDTEKLFGETLRYRDQLVGRLGLTGVRDIHPDQAEIAVEDPNGSLWLRQPDRCCHLRKVVPLEKALHGFDAWITGRKRFQGESRSMLEAVEAKDGRTKINPLVLWSAADIERYLTDHDLPRHPLVADGYLSIGCMPCTDRVAPGEDARAGRWRGRDKDECGIHLPRGAVADVVGIE